MTSTHARAVIAPADREADDAVLVVVFLRGGADGLNIVVPYGDDDYHRARPTIGLRKPDLVDLDGFFGLNPLLRPLEPHWKEGRLAAIHCVGSEDSTRSHFEAQDLMEHGGLVAGGWLGRYLRVRPGAGHSPLAAVALGPTLPECLRGSPGAAAISSINEFSLGDNSAAFATELARLYAGVPGLLGAAGAAAMAARERIEKLTHPPAPAKASGAAPPYGDDGFSRGLGEIARLIKGRIGLQAACIDLGGWDSHLTQDAIMNPPLGRLGTGLAAFAGDLGDDLRRTTIVVMTEFGRRVSENTALGTDHGRGSVMFVMGADVRGAGRVHGEWPGLKPESLEGPGDLPVRINYRDVLAPILARHSPGIELANVFPDYALSPVAAL